MACGEHAPAEHSTHPLPTWRHMRDRQAPARAHRHRPRPLRTHATHRHVQGGAACRAQDALLRACPWVLDEHVGAVLQQHLRGRAHPGKPRAPGPAVVDVSTAPADQLLRLGTPYTHAHPCTHSTARHTHTARTHMVAQIHMFSAFANEHLPQQRHGTLCLQLPALQQKGVRHACTRAALHSSLPRSQAMQWRAAREKSGTCRSAGGHGRHPLCYLPSRHPPGLCLFCLLEDPARAGLHGPA